MMVEISAFVLCACDEARDDRAAISFARRISAALFLVLRPRFLRSIKIFKSVVDLESLFEVLFERALIFLDVGGQFGDRLIAHDELAEQMIDFLLRTREHQLAAHEINARDERHILRSAREAHQRGRGGFLSFCVAGTAGFHFGELGAQLS